jgi:hypothetical protein
MINLKINFFLKVIDILGYNTKEAEIKIFSKKNMMNLKTN